MSSVYANVSKLRRWGEKLLEKEISNVSQWDTGCKSGLLSGNTRSTGPGLKYSKLYVAYMHSSAFHSPLVIPWETFKPLFLAYSHHSFETILKVKWYMKCFIYWTEDLKSSKLWSSQLWTQFKQVRIEAWKSQDFNGVWTRDLAIPVRRRWSPVFFRLLHALA